VNEDTSTRADDGRVIADPSALTTASLLREVAHLKELFNTQIGSVEIRMNAIEKASEVFQDGLTRVPTQVQQEIAHLKELHESKFHAIHDKFDVRDVTARHAAEADALALQAAFDAQKGLAASQAESSERAIAKAEAATTKQIDQAIALIGANKASQDAMVGDLKDRVIAIEGRGSGYASSWVIFLGALGGVGTIAGLVALVVALTGGGG
jgi:hypothetical protein